MKETYTRTMTINNLVNAKVIIDLYENCKYFAKSHADLGETRKVEYTGLSSWSIVTGNEAKEIEDMTDGSCIDEFHEYLVLSFEDGSEVTFRNSHVDMFLR